MTIALLLSAKPAIAAGLFTQLILNLETNRRYQHEYNQRANSLILEIEKTKPSELGAFEFYDERLIRRVIMKDLGPQGTSVEIKLRSPATRASIYHFNEPFRIVIDLFDDDYAEERDVATQLPYANPGTPAAESPDEPNAPAMGDAPRSAEPQHRLVDSASSAQAENRVQRTGAGKHRLLQPVPEIFTRPEQMNAALEKVESGLGKSWGEYPIYIYRLQTAPYEKGEPRGRRLDQAKAEAVISDTQAMADYAGNLYNLGHENKALIAYSQVLQKEPQIFEKDALHLWKFAEVQLSQGSLTLAKGYYAAIMQKHPESPLAKFAALRRLDLESIAAAKTPQPGVISKLAAGLNNISGSGEIQAQIAIRRAYWQQDGKPIPKSREELPLVSKDVGQVLSATYQSAEAAKTAFLAGSLLLRFLINEPWHNTTGLVAADYFKRFTGEAAEPFRTQLKDQLQAKLNTTIQTMVNDGKLVESIRLYEELPELLKSIKKTPATAWALGEAYRQLGQGDTAVDFYRTASKTTTNDLDRFKADFWLAVTAGNSETQLKITGGSTAERQVLSDLRKRADGAMLATWMRLNEEEKTKLFTALRPNIEDTISNPVLLSAPAKILLERWQKAQTAATGEEKTDWDKNFSPNAGSIFLATNLAKRFGELGLKSQRRESLLLLRAMTPKEFKDDKEAKKIWADQLNSLAEEYRTANEYLEAGRLYKLVGDETPDWEGRAETLYKAGLLLFRAGRRKEAVEAFTAAAQDTNNLKYSQLSKERLNQLEE
jgi:tetratricopeptide (TPR) repeat protein